MKAGAIVMRLAAATLLCSPVLSSTAAAVEPEKQPIYSNTPGGLMCGIRSMIPLPTDPIRCTVPAGQRLIIEYVSGYAFRFASTDTTFDVALVVSAPSLGLNDGAFHNFVATKTETSGGTDVFTFSTPFRLMLPAKSTFYFTADSVAVSGYLVKQ
jgi:hypothetical protein